MSGASKTATGKRDKPQAETEPGRSHVSPRQVVSAGDSKRRAGSARAAALKKRGWRDIEALAERARLKQMLTDIWHEDIEIDDEIFGLSEQQSIYYTDIEQEDIELDVAEDDADEFDDFDEDD